MNGGYDGHRAVAAIDSNEKSTVKTVSLRAKLKGKHMGRPRSLTPEQQKEAQRARARRCAASICTQSRDIDRPPSAAPPMRQEQRRDRAALLKRPYST